MQERFASSRMLSTTRELGCDQLTSRRYFLMSVRLRESVSLGVAITATNSSLVKSSSSDYTRSGHGTCGRGLGLG